MLSVTLLATSTIGCTSNKISTPKDTGIPVIKAENPTTAPAKTPAPELSTLPEISLSIADKIDTDLYMEPYVENIFHGDAELAKEVSDFLGKKVPNFKFASLDGEQKEISNYLGKPFILDLMRTTCPYCVKLMPELETFKQSNPDIPVLSVSVTESVAEINTFIEENAQGEDIHTLIDSTDVVALYNINKVPALFFVDADGVIQFVTYGDLSADKIQEYAKISFNLTDKEQ